MFLMLPPTILDHFPATFLHSWIIRPWRTPNSHALCLLRPKCKLYVALQKSQVTRSTFVVWLGGSQGNLAYTMCLGMTR